MRHRGFTFLAIALLLAPAAWAGNGLVGLSAGQTSLDNDVAGTDYSANDTGWKLFGGYDFVRYFGVEGGYTDMGSMSTSYAGTDVTSDISGFGIYARGMVPIGSSFELFGKVGYLMWDADTTVEAGALSASASDSGNDLAFGAGAAWHFNERYGVRLEYEVFDIEETDTTSFASVGFAFSF